MHSAAEHCGCALDVNIFFVQVIIVMDPAAAGKPRLPIIRHSSDIKVPPREKRYVFDKAYDGNTDNRTLYNGTVKVSLTMMQLMLPVLPAKLLHKGGASISVYAYLHLYLAYTVTL